MGGSSWPSETELNELKKKVAKMSGRSAKEVRIVVSPYRICPLGAHIDHQGGIVLAMTINKGILLGFVPSGDPQVLLQSGQFQGEVRFRVDEVQYPIGSTKSIGSAPSSKLGENNWGTYARGAVYALQREQKQLTQGIIGLICGSEGLDSSGLSSSAAAGVAYLLALQSANDLTLSPDANIELDRLIENEYLSLKNGILDQSAILLSRSDCLTCMNCKTKEHRLIKSPRLQTNHGNKETKEYKILIAFSGLKQALTENVGYNYRVSECQGAAKVLLEASGNGQLEPLLCNVKEEAYETYKGKLNSNHARRAEHYFSENARVTEGVEAWIAGDFKHFGRLISASGLSSIENYECGCEPLKDLYEILLRTPGVVGARFSGAGFRGCCFAFVEADHATEAATFVRNEYKKAQPELANQLNNENAVLICEAGDHARILV